MRELTMDELEQVSGAGWPEAMSAWGTGAFLGTATYGTTWATIGALAAFVGSPIVASAMVGLALYGGYQVLQD